MLVSGCYRFELDPGRSRQLTRLTRVVTRQATIIDQLDIDSGLLPHFAQRCFVWQLMRFDVAARRQPAPKPGMRMQQDTPLMHDEHGHGEIPRDDGGTTDHVNHRAGATRAETMDPDAIVIISKGHHRDGNRRAFALSLRGAVPVRSG